MRIVFFGSPSAALPSLEKLLDAGHEVKLMITQPDKPSGRGQKSMPCAVKAFAISRGIPTYEPERIRKDPVALDKLRAANPEVNVVVAYGQIIPAPIIYFPKHKSLNVHFSLLPKFRGAAPVQWALLSGEAKTGVTIFELNEKMDEGHIYATTEVLILPGENALELEMRLANVGAGLLLETLAEIDRINPIPQDQSLATYAPKLQKEDGKIDWNLDADVIGRKVQAVTPWPSAYTFFRKKRLIILRGSALTGPFPPETRPASPGTVVAVEKQGMTVACKNGSRYRIERLRPENKAAMDAYAFSLGAKIDIGDII
jgi:methionyl-tRNA formyltransferase